MNVSFSVSFSVYSSLSSIDLFLLVLTLVLYALGLLLTSFLVLVISSDARLHRPMYVLLMNLALSSVVGGSSFCPTVLRFLLLNERKSSLGECLTQVFFTNVYSGCVFCILGLMAFDRYVSICKPLRYHAIMTPTRLKIMLFLVYFALISMSAIQVHLTSRLTLCEYSIDKLMCDTLSVSKLACHRTTLISMFGLCCAICFIICPCFLVILSYVNIFIVILKTSKHSQKKALKTCTPHLVTFVNFSVVSFFGVIYSRVGDRVPKSVNIVFSLVFFIVPPLLHPVIYGIKTQEIQQSIKRALYDHITHIYCNFNTHFIG